MEKNNFETLSHNKTTFLLRLALDDELAKCMINNHTNFQDNVITEDDKYSLIYSHIFPYLKTTGTLVEDGSYITMRFKYRKVKGQNVFKAAYITFYIFCTESVIQTDYQVLKTDYILQQVDRLLSDTRNESWLGKLEMDSMEDVNMDSEGKYIGISVTYKNVELQ